MPQTPGTRRSAPARDRRTEMKPPVDRTSAGPEDDASGDGATALEGGPSALASTTTQRWRRPGPNGRGNIVLQSPFLQTQARTSRIALLRAPAAVEGGAGLGCAGMGGRGSAMTASLWYGAWQSRASRAWRGLGSTGKHCTVPVPLVHPVLPQPRHLPPQPLAL